MKKNFLVLAFAAFLVLLSSGCSDSGDENEVINGSGRIALNSINYPLDLCTISSEGPADGEYSHTITIKSTSAGNHFTFYTRTSTESITPGTYNIASSGKHTAKFRVKGTNTVSGSVTGIMTVSKSNKEYTFTFTGNTDAAKTIGMTYTGRINKK